MGRGAVILGPEGPWLTPREKAFFREADPWGFILFARNIHDPRAVRGLIADLREAVGWDAPVLIDQEGGRVQRLRGPDWRVWHPPLEQVRRAGPEGAARSMWLRYRLIAQELSDLGIDVNCAPLADVALPETHPFLRNRCVGDTPDEVTRNARAAARGLTAGGVLPVVKHIPGHGRGQVDSHLSLPVVAAEREELEDIDFAPFRALADLPLGMTAHIVYPALDDRPATESPEVVRLIREEIGFGGLLMTDDISMQALEGSIAQRAARSIAAGCDLVLHCNGDAAEMAQAVQAAGTLSPDAAARADRALALRQPPEALDIAAAEDELARLLDGHVYD
ncbi:glycoside hydrolase family 3 protein [Mesobaculum littorinae]|uniref:beta-N-acetylhexosaminidase n=1 Tax=Mesobaculum littorinae TaxID=2486419 RepID=A0A438AJJ4_9RHOB|nr:glycoside hydrolase family 3 N-terminal domain-containing protein [Mesobaculum littorinae]RVV98816.1 glycoside hydrolase family 3 protein [Mesobaculum littorinae]